MTGNISILWLAVIVSKRLLQVKNERYVDFQHVDLVNYVETFSKVHFFLVIS